MRLSSKGGTQWNKPERTRSVDRHYSHLLDLADKLFSERLIQEFWG
jgi:hypothetical protein